MLGGVRMIPRIKTVKPLDDYILYVVFDDGKKVLYDVKEDIGTIESYRDLQDIYGFFQHVQLDQSRTCVFWNDEIDLPSDAIYEYGKILEVEPKPDELEAIAEAKVDTSATVPHDSINWD
jgi:hypothetical protein